MVDKDGLDELCKFAKTDRETMKVIWEEVQRNRKKLDGCDGPHQFKPIQIEDRQIARDYRCTKCGGKLDAMNTIWYNKGLEHGGKK